MATHPEDARSLLAEMVTRWYLHTLVTRPKWTKEALSPRIAVYHPLRNLSAYQVATGTQLHPEDDGVVRVVTLKTASSELIRPLIKLVLLPEDGNAFTSHKNAPKEKRSGE